jgi:hypothetical protein
MILLAMFAFAALARADALGPPRRDCPAGARGMPWDSHGGGWCAPAPCRRARDCNMPYVAGTTCARRGVCVVPHGRSQQVIGSCDARGPCENGLGRCRFGRYCGP